MGMRIALLCMLAWPSGAVADSWHEFGDCLYATQVAAESYDDQQGPIALSSGQCTKDVSNSIDSFVVRLTWLDGKTLRIAAQNRRNSLEVFINNQPAVITSAPILGYNDCYATSIDNGFKHYCFKGNGMYFDGSSIPVAEIPKEWELSRDW
jgi:hypothetical protein